MREYHRSAASPDRADPTGRIVWRTDHGEAANHNGGQLDFGPDGMLWFATGDGGGQDNQFGHARDLGSPLGKLLRIDPHPGGARRLHGPRRQPVRHRAVGLRPAQPVPLLLRHPRQQGPLHRRRRPGRARGDQPGALRRRPRQGRRLRLVLPRGHGRRPDGLHDGRELPRADLRLRAGRPARGDRRPRRARPRPPEPARPLRLRRRLRRGRALVRPGHAARDRRPRRGAPRAPHARVLRRGRLRARLRRLDRRQRRPHPGRRRSAPASCAPRPPRSPPLRPPRAGPPALPDRTSPRVRIAAGRARAASACGRRRGSR